MGFRRIGDCRLPRRGGCNYNADATDAGDCDYAEDYYDCDSNCLNDADGDGVCDELEIIGCQDEVVATTTRMQRTLAIVTMPRITTTVTATV